MDGANGAFGPSGRGIGFSTATWESMTGIVVEEIVVSYRSPEDARSDFEVALRDGGSVTERTDNTAASHQRAVKVFDTQARQGACEIITLSGQRIHFVKAGALKYALGFEKAWIKF